MKKSPLMGLSVRVINTSDPILAYKLYGEKKRKKNRKIMTWHDVLSLSLSLTLYLSLCYPSALHYIANIWIFFVVVIFTDITMSLYRKIKIRIKPKAKRNEKANKERNGKRPTTIYLWLNHFPMDECNAMQ